MRNHLGLLPLPRPQAPPPPAGVCRVCGCTDEEACVTWSGELAGAVKATCSWVERDLCSRCHGPHRPTRAQAGELGRIRAAVGPIDVRPGILAGELQVDLLGIAPAGWSREWIPYRTLRMNRAGAVIRQGTTRDIAAAARRFGLSLS